MTEILNPILDSPELLQAFQERDYRLGIGLNRHLFSLIQNSEKKWYIEKEDKVIETNMRFSHDLQTNTTTFRFLGSNNNMTIEFVPNRFVRFEAKLFLTNFSKGASATQRIAAIVDEPNTYKFYTVDADWLEDTIGSFYYKQMS